MRNRGPDKPTSRFIAVLVAAQKKAYGRQFPSPSSRGRVRSPGWTVRATTYVQGSAQLNVPAPDRASRLRGQALALAGDTPNACDNATIPSR